jgi:hypothetical protein
MKIFLFLCLFFSTASGLEAATSLSIRVLARVADTSISDRELVIDWLLQNPRSFVSGRRDYFSGDVQNKLLQESIIQILVEEENRIVGTQTIAPAAIEKELQDLKKSYGARWSAFLNDFEISESDIRARLSRSLLVNQTLETRLRDSFQGLGADDEEAALERAENSLQAWLQQLRSRYRVQIFKYGEI